MDERAALGIRSGDTVRVWQKIEEKGKTRRQAFEGLVLAVKHGTEPGGSFIVRKLAAGGVAVEKIYPRYSPTLKKIEIVSRPKVRRAKLYFLRSRTGQAARRLGLGVAVEAEADSSELKKEETPVKTK